MHIAPKNTLSNRQKSVCIKPPLLLMNAGNYWHFRFTPRASACIKISAGEHKDSLRIHVTQWRRRYSHWQNAVVSLPLWAKPSNRKLALVSSLMYKESFWPLCVFAIFSFLNSMIILYIVLDGAHVPKTSTVRPTSLPSPMRAPGVKLAFPHV